MNQSVDKRRIKGSVTVQDAVQYLAYEGAIGAQGTKVTVTVKGRFIGGTGRYQGASGNVELSSLNGFFNNGKGVLSLTA